jgi:hypothetical protein
MQPQVLRLKGRVPEDPDEVYLEAPTFPHLVEVGGDELLLEPVSPQLRDCEPEGAV